MDDLPRGFGELILRDISKNRNYNKSVNIYSLNKFSIKASYRASYTRKYICFEDKEIGTISEAQTSRPSISSIKMNRNFEKLKPYVIQEISDKENILRQAEDIKLAKAKLLTKKKDFEEQSLANKIAGMFK